MRTTSSDAAGAPVTTLDLGVVHRRNAAAGLIEAKERALLQLGLPLHVTLDPRDLALRNAIPQLPSH